MHISRYLNRNKVKPYSFELILNLILIVLVFLSFVPMLMSIFMSLKSNAQILGDFWGLPSPVMWSNFTDALFGLLPNMINTLIIVLTTALGVVILSGMSGYVFAQLKFPFKNTLFVMVLSIMMVPAVVTLTPNFTLVLNLGIRNTWLALWTNYLAYGQVFGIILCRTFIAGQPKELFESARIDGSSELRSFFAIALPLARPILVTLAVLNIVGTYGDYIWPLLVISTPSRQTLMVAVTGLVSEIGASERGVQTAGYVFASLPLLVLFTFGMKYFVSGMTSGAVKA